MPISLFYFKNLLGILSTWSKCSISINIHVREIKPDWKIELDKPNETFPVTNGLKCLDTSGAALKNPPVVKPRHPAASPRQAVAVEPQDGGINDKIERNNAHPTNAIELYKRNFAVSDKHLTWIW